MRRPEVCFATASIKVAGANGAYTRASSNGPSPAIASSIAGMSRKSTAAAITYGGPSVVPRASTVTLKPCPASVSVAGRRIAVPPNTRVHIPMTSADDLVFFLQDAGKLLWLTGETGLAAAGYIPGEIG
jgi:hypothetical protein